MKIIFSVCIVIFVGMVFWQAGLNKSIFISKQGSKAEADDKNIKERQRLVSALSGRLIIEDLINLRPLAVVVENHPDSRPQSGLSKAEIIYETVTEGGITRFLAIFQDESEDIGPVRSARPYFSELADSLGALFVHVGGSPEALVNITKGKYKNLIDLNEFYHADFFERIRLRKAPHNTYTSTEKLREFERQNKISQDKFVNINAVNGLQFIGTENMDHIYSKADLITIDFSKPAFKVEFRYDGETNSYKRFISGEAAVDALTQKQIAPTTIIIQETNITRIPGDKDGRVKVRTTGGGSIYVFNNGLVIEGKWNREAGKPVEYQDMSDRPINVIPGQIWVALVEDGVGSWE